MSKSRTWTAKDLLGLIRLRYHDQRRYAVYANVNEGTGYQARSWIDAMVVHLWPSDNYKRFAFEIKVSRNDLVRELQTPSKNAWARECCHAFWYVTPKGILKDASELPEGCGWMHPRGDRLVVGRMAQVKNTATFDEALMVSLLRKGQDAAGEVRREARHHLVNNDPEIIRAFKWMKACERFLDQHGVRGFPASAGGESVEKAAQLLEQATLEGRDRKDRDAILERLEQFKGTILELFMDFAELAHIGLLEIDGTGAYVLDRWHGGNPLDAAAMRVRAKSFTHLEARIRGLDLLEKARGDKDA